MVINVIKKIVPYIAIIWDELDETFNIIKEECAEYDIEMKENGRLSLQHAYREEDSLLICRTNAIVKNRATGEIAVFNKEELASQFVQPTNPDEVKNTENTEDAPSS